MGGTVAVNNRSHFAAGLAAMLEHLLPEERFVLVTPGDVVPAEAQVLVTLLDDPSGLEDLLVPQVRWVHMLSTGIDGFPLAAAGDRVVTCSRGASATAISEWVLAVMLSYEKKLPEAFVTGPWAQGDIPALGGLAGKTLGLVGLGAIGSAIARRALAFDMKVTAVRRTSTPPPSGVTLAPSLEALAAGADHLVVAAPATPQTAGLIDGRVLAACKPGVHLVNVARGALVDQDALLSALDAGTVGRASLDVVDPEPLPEGHPLYHHAAVRLSPHISWSSPASVTTTIEKFVDNVGRYRRGEALEGAVDVAAGY